MDRIALSDGRIRTSIDQSPSENNARRHSKRSNVPTSSLVKKKHEAGTTVSRPLVGRSVQEQVHRDRRMVHRTIPTGEIRSVPTRRTTTEGLRDGGERPFMSMGLMYRISFREGSQ